MSCAGCEFDFEAAGSKLCPRFSFRIFFLSDFNPGHFVYRRFLPVSPRVLQSGRLSCCAKVRGSQAQLRPRAKARYGVTRLGESVFPLEHSRGLLDLVFPPLPLWVFFFEGCNANHNSPLGDKLCVPVVFFGLSRLRGAKNLFLLRPNPITGIGRFAYRAGCGEV